MANENDNQEVLINEEKESIKRCPNKKSVIKPVVGIIVLVTLVFLYSNFGFKQKYNTSVDRYNYYADSLNYLVENYSEELGEAPVSVDKKDYFQNDSNEGTKSERLRKLNDDVLEIQKTLSQYELSIYRAVLGSYNNEVKNYNYLISRLDSYGVDVSKYETVEEINNKISETELASKYPSFEEYETGLVELINSRDSLKDDYYEVCLKSYNGLIDDYNLVAEAYNEKAQECVIEYIDGFSSEYELLNEDDGIDKLSNEEIFNNIEEILGKTSDVLEAYCIINQIINPTEEWVLGRLGDVNGIKKSQAVTKDNDPNGLLGKAGGYTSCIYFSLKELDDSKIKGNNIIEKGTDGGGAIEIYDNKEYALNRCDYLSQFDGTLLCSGSYTCIGTMVIRTSYLLDDDKQIALIDEIIKALTNIDSSK